MIRATSLVAPLATLALVAGCSGSAGQSGAASRSDSSSPFADCAALTSAPTSGGAAGSGQTATPTSGGSGQTAAPTSGGSGQTAAGGKALPDLELPCFSGGQQVNIADIRGPAVINLWASWCGPCRAELPAMQRLAQRSQGRVHVIGVISQDDRGAAKSLATDLGVTFPALDDKEAFLLGRVGKTALPVTVFVNAQNKITYTYNSVPLDDASLAKLADRYLGVAVSQ